VLPRHASARIFERVKHPVRVVDVVDGQFVELAHGGLFCGDETPRRPLVREFGI